MKKLLCISIPTYNRSDYLYRALFSIQQQIYPGISLIVNIFDNNSIDDTESVARVFEKNNSDIFKYYRNHENIGPDLNIAQSYFKSNAKYTLVFGDDDVFLDGALLHLLAALKSDREYGLIFMNYYGFKKNYIDERPGSKNEDYFLAYEMFGDSILKIMGVRTGFISACVVNNKAINVDDLKNNAGTNFNHLFPIIKSTSLGFYNLYFKSYMVAQQDGNSGGFDYFKLIANNFYKIFISLVGVKSKATRALETEIIFKILPAAIIFSRLRKYPDYKIESLKLISENYKHRFIYWIFNFPLINFPIPIVLIIKYPILLASKIYFKIFNVNNINDVYKKISL